MTVGKQSKDNCKYESDFGTPVIEANTRCCECRWWEPSARDVCRVRITSGRHRVCFKRRRIISFDSSHTPSTIRAVLKCEPHVQVLRQSQSRHKALLSSASWSSRYCQGIAELQVFARHAFSAEIAMYLAGTLNVTRKICVMRLGPGCVDHVLLGTGSGHQQNTSLAKKSLRKSIVALDDAPKAEASRRRVVDSAGSFSNETWMEQ